MNDRNVSRKTHNGYSGATGKIYQIFTGEPVYSTFFFLGYGKSYKDGRGYNGRSTGPSSLIQAAPKKRVQLRPVQVFISRVVNLISKIFDFAKLRLRKKKHIFANNIVFECRSQSQHNLIF